MNWKEPGMGQAGFIDSNPNSFKKHGNKNH